MNKEFLFIVTYGRSGSTLLMSILNSIPGYRITGENNMACTSLMEYHHKMIQAHASNYTCMQNHNTIGPSNPWWNEYNPYTLKKKIRELMAYCIDPKDEHRVVGFKEIRYPHLLYNWDTPLYTYLDWLYEITNCRFILLTRNLDDVCRSEWLAKHYDENKIKFIQFEHAISDYMYQRLHQHLYHITYEQIIEEDLQELFEWLGEPLDITRIDQILRMPHSFKTTGPIKTKENNYGRKQD